MEQLKQTIIEECAKYGYNFDGEGENKELEEIWLTFENPNECSELNSFVVIIDIGLEQVTMYLSIDMGSFNDAIDSDINNIEDIKENIRNWLCKENLNEVKKWLLEEGEE